MRMALIAALTGLLLIACADNVKPGRDLFHACDVNVKASQSAGRIACRPGTEFVAFDGNGRSCGSCHRAEDRFGMSAATRASLAPDDAFFYPGLDEDLALLEEHGLVHVIGDGLNEFRQTPSLNELCTLCNKYGDCESLGLNSDRVTNLHAFTIGAVINHHAKSAARIPGADFVLPSLQQREDLVDYMLSDDVCDGF